MPLFAGALPPSLAIDVDARVALFTAALALVIGLVFGAVAAYRPGARLVDSLVGATRSTASASAGRTRNALVVAQVTLAVVLLSAAGLLLTTMGRLARVDPGFAADHVLTFRVALLGGRYSSPPARVAFVSDLLDRLRAVPGVRNAAVSSVVPFGGARNANAIEVEGRPVTDGSRTIIDQRHVSPGYFETMKIPLVQRPSPDGHRRERRRTGHRHQSDDGAAGISQ